MRISLNRNLRRMERTRTTLVFTQEPIRLEKLFRSKLKGRVCAISSPANNKSRSCDWKTYKERTLVYDVHN